MRSPIVPNNQKLMGGSAHLVPCRADQVRPSASTSEVTATINGRFSVSIDNNGPTEVTLTTSSSSASPGKRRPPPGFLNLGNTCYANAALQCLFSTALSRALLEPRCFPVFRQYSSNGHLMILAEEDLQPDLVSETISEINFTNIGSLNGKQQPPLPSRPKGLSGKEAATIKPSWLKTPNRQRRNQMSELCHWVTEELTDLCLKYRKKIAPHSSASVAVAESNEQLPSLVAKIFTNCGKPPRSPNVVDPGNITRHVGRLSNCLRFGRQEDSHEFLRSLLSAMTMDGFNKDLSSLFDGLLESSVTCQHCGHASITRDRYMDLSLEIGNVEIKSLVDALEHFTREEILTGDNKVYCEACKCNQHSSKRLRLATSPSILVCHLKRFDYDIYGRLRRLNKQISFSPNLDISPFMSLENKSIPPTYELVAFVSHQGRSCSSGHYIAYVRGSGGHKGASGRPWYRVSDSDVQEVDLDTVLKKEAYILMYEVKGMRHHNIDGDCGSICSSSRINKVVSESTTVTKDNSNNWVIASKTLFQQCSLVDAREEEQQSKKVIIAANERHTDLPVVTPAAQNNNLMLDILHQCGLVDLSEGALGFCFTNSSANPSSKEGLIDEQVEKMKSNQEVSKVSANLLTSPEKRKNGENGQATDTKTFHEDAVRGRTKGGVVPTCKERKGRSLSNNRIRRRENVPTHSGSRVVTATNDPALLRSSNVVPRHTLSMIPHRSHKSIHSK